MKTHRGPSFLWKLHCGQVLSVSVDLSVRIIREAKNVYPNIVGPADNGTVAKQALGDFWMRAKRFLCVIGLSVLSAVVAGSQSASSVALSGELRAHVQNEQFGIVTSIRGLPLGVRDGLQRLFGSPSLDIAEPKAEFQAGNVTVNSKLPSRRLVVAGCSYDHCLVYYERGGTAHTWRVALFHWTPDATRFEWGGIAPGSLTTIDAVRSTILSGAIKDPAGLW
jgi:hypothetical protein